MPSNPGCLAGPRKPWEGVPSTSGPSPFRPSSSACSTTAVVESLGGAAEHGAKYPSTNVGSCHGNGTITGRPMPLRPWERNATNSYVGYGSTPNYNNNLGPHGTNAYYGGRIGSQYDGGGYGPVGLYGGAGADAGMYGGQGLVRSTLYRGDAGLHGGGYGGGMYGGAYGMGIGAPPMFGGDPNRPLPSGPPSLWQSMLKVLYGVVTFVGRVSVLVDQNTHAFHSFISALLQLFDRAGLLYGELARFVLRLLGMHGEPRARLKVQGSLVPSSPSSVSLDSESKEIGGVAWDHVWSGKDVKKCS